MSGGSQNVNGSRSISLHGDTPNTFVNNEVRTPCSAQHARIQHRPRRTSGSSSLQFARSHTLRLYSLRLLGDSTPHLRKFPSVAARVQIRTGKYLNWIVFLPQNIFEQFARAANLFYLFLSIISGIPGVRHAAPAKQTCYLGCARDRRRLRCQVWAAGPSTNLIPLVFVLAVRAFKDAFEELQRKRVRPAGPIDSRKLELLLRSLVNLPMSSCGCSLMHVPIASL